MEVVIDRWCDASRSMAASFAAATQAFELLLTALEGLAGLGLRPSSDDWADMALEGLRARDRDEVRLCLTESWREFQREHGALVV